MTISPLLRYHKMDDTEIAFIRYIHSHPGTTHKEFTLATGLSLNAGVLHNLMESRVIVKTGKTNFPDASTRVYTYDLTEKMKEILVKEGAAGI